MSKTKTTLEVNLVLPKTFKQKIISAMRDEFKIASHKWSIEIDSAMKKKIIENSILQLNRKVSTVSSSNWTLDNETLKVCVKSGKSKPEAITLPDKTIKGIMLVRTHDGFKVDYDPNPGTIKIEHFYKLLLSEIENWARTAVFYGVGSCNRI
jgi:hypothetical protein